MCERRPLRVHKKCDICIVGAGITGLSLAYMLSKYGKSVIVVDDGPIGGGDTSRTTAHICVEFDTRYADLKNIHGIENTILALKSQQLAMSTIFQLIEKEKIDCELKEVPGYLIPGSGQGPDVLQNEYNACRELGLKEVQLIDTPFLPWRKPRPALLFPRQGRFNALKYLNGLLACLEHDGVRIYGNTHLNSFVDGGDIETHLSSNAVITAKNLVLATHSPVSDLVSMHTKQFPYRTYVVTNTLTTFSIMEDCLLWDTEDPYHYARIEADPHGNGNLLIVGGEDHRTGQECDHDERYNRLEAWAKDLLPGVGARHSTWSGQIYETADGLPYIGVDPEHEKNVFIATGLSGCGMTLGTLAALLICDLILERENVFSDLYDPRRLSLKVLPRYLKENLNSVSQYSQYFGTQRDLKTAISEIPDGEGEVIHCEHGPIAVSKDEKGKAVMCSAVCPHLKAIVNWNSDEKSWDCPAHGSRFDPRGRVLNGPANSDLSKFELPDHEETDGDDKAFDKTSSLARRKIDESSSKGGPHVA